MNRCLSTLFVLLTGAALVGSPPAWAQSESAPLINLKFPGGTIAEYVAALRETAGETNIVVMPEAQDIQIPPIELNSVVLASALELLQGEFQLQGRTLVKVEIDKVSRYEEAERPIYRVLAEVRRGRPSETQVRVWNVSGLLKALDMKSEDVLTAVETAMNMLGGDYGPAQISFHEATGLVIARGHPERMRAIGQVIDQLAEGLKRQREEARRETEEDLRKHAEGLEHTLHSQSLELEMEELRIRHQALSHEHERLQRENEALLQEMGQKVVAHEPEEHQSEPADK